MSCENCYKGTILPGEPTGTMVDGAYLAAGTDETKKDRAVVQLTDIFGLPLVNCKIQADLLAKRLGCDVWVPDLFNGRPPAGINDMEGIAPERAGESIGIFGAFRLIARLLPRIHVFYANRAQVVDARIHTFVKKIKEEKKYTKVGAVGYCFGGSVAIRLAATDLFDSVVIAHPGQCNVAEFKAMKVPAAWACAEEDMSFKPALRQAAEEAYKEKKDVPYEFIDYKGTAHGFAVRPNQKYPEVKAGYEGATDQTVKWFEKTLF